MTYIPAYAPFEAVSRSDDGRYSYELKSGPCIYLTPEQHTKFGLLQLATPEFWLDVAGDGNGGIDWDRAASVLMQTILGKMK